MTDGSRVKCISPLKMRKCSGKWQEHPSTPFTGVLESCHSVRVNGHLSRLTKEHKVSESPDMCQGGGGGWGRRACGEKNHHLATISHHPCQEYPIKLHLTASETTGSVTSFNPGGRWSANSFFSFRGVHLFSPSHLFLPLFVWCQRRLGPSASTSPDSLSVWAPFNTQQPCTVTQKLPLASRLARREKRGLGYTHLSALINISCCLYVFLFSFVFSPLSVLCFLLHATTTWQGVQVLQHLLVCQEGTETNRKKCTGQKYIQPILRSVVFAFRAALTLSSATTVEYNIFIWTIDQIT